MTQRLEAFAMGRKTRGLLLSVLVNMVAVSIATVALWAGGHAVDLTFGIARNLGLAALLWLCGYQFFGGRFVRPRWKAIGKGVAFMTMSLFLFIWAGLWAWPLILAHQGIGMISHIVICRKHDIDWVTVEPRQRYIVLMEKWGKGDLG